MSFKLIINPDRCKACELCVVSCPKKILKLSDRTNKYGFRITECSDESICTGCQSCAMVCPEVAIEIVKEIKE